MNQYITEYLGRTSLLAKKQLTNIFRSCSKDIKFNVIFKTSNRLRKAFRFKDLLPKCISSKVLHKYKCNIWNNVYIGKTKRHLIARQYDHFTDNFSILGNAMNNYHLSLKESLLIFIQKPSLNVAKESIPLYLFDNDSEHY